MLSSLVHRPRIIQIGLSTRLATANCMQANGDVRDRAARNVKRQKYIERYFLFFMQKKTTLGLQDKLNMSFGHFRRLGMTIIIFTLQLLAIAITLYI